MFQMIKRGELAGTSFFLICRFYLMIPKILNRCILHHRAWSSPKGQVHTHSRPWRNARQTLFLPPVLTAATAICTLHLPIKPTEECARSTARRLNYAVVTDVQMEPSKEECAEGMEQSRQRKQQCRSEGCNNAVVKGGVCIKHTGAEKKRKLWLLKFRPTRRSERCTNVVQQGGVCKRHGAELKQCKCCTFNGCTI